MEFTGLSLLTKDVLPGIPLTRMRPLESIMVEALQTSTETKRRKKTLKVKMKVTEQAEEPEKDEHGCVVGKQKWDAEAEKCVDLPVEQATDPPATCGEGEIWDAKQGKCVPTGETGQTEQVTTPTDLTKPLSPGQRDLGIGAVEPDEHGQCPDGYIINDTLGKCVRDESCPEGKHFDHKAQQCVDDMPPRVETPETAVGLSPAPKEDLVTVDTTPGEAPYERPMPVPEPTPPSPSSTRPSQMPPEAEPAPEAQPLEPLTLSKTPPLQPLNLQL